MSRVLHAVCSTPWWITPGHLQTILEVAAREHEVTPEAIERMRGERLEETSRARVRDGVAIIPVRGPIFRYANLFTAFSGATSSEVLANDIGAALENRRVRQIVFDIDSPGGMVNGTGELAKLIYSARGEKPMTSFISGLGASAAYYIASAADQVLADRSAIVGSIGTILEVVDYKRMDERQGVRTLEFVSAQSPRKRMDPFDDDDEKRDDARAQIQTLVDDLAAVFIEDVALYRGVSVDSVLDDFGMGGVLVGQAALDAGLVDGLKTLEELLEDLTQDRRPRGIVGLRPAAELPAPPSDTDDEESLMSDKEKGTAAAPPVIDRAYLQANHPELVTALQAEGASSERERITAIQGLHGPEDVKAACVKDPACSAGDAALKLNAAQKAADEARGKAHLEQRAGAEEGVSAPGPSGDAGAGDDVQKTVARALAIHSAMQGQTTPAQA